MMKIKLTPRLLQLVFLLAASGFYTYAYSQVTNVSVDLAFNSDQTELNATTRGGCQRANHPGCIRVEKDKMIRLHLKLPGNQRTCNRPGGKTWQLANIYLGGKNSSSKPTAFGNLDWEVKQDFNVADTATGRLIKHGSSNENQIVIFDGNNHKYDIWYKVTANCVDVNGNIVASIETDPRIENDGTTQ